MVNQEAVILQVILKMNENYCLEHFVKMQLE